MPDVKLIGQQIDQMDLLAGAIMNSASHSLMSLESAIHTLDGINRGISSIMESGSSITPMQIYCMLELISGALN
jgi:hypothetical protein